MDRIKKIIEKNTPLVDSNGEIFKADISLENLSKEDIENLAKKYKTEPRNIVLESLLKQGIDVTRPEYFMLNEILREIDPIDFASSSTTENMMRSYVQERAQLVQSAKDEYKKYENLLKKCGETRIKTTEFIQDAKAIHYIYSYEDPHEIFNSIEPSENISYIELNYKNLKTYKLYLGKKLLTAPEYEAPESKVYIVMKYKNSAVIIYWESLKMHITFDLDIDDENGENIILGSIKTNITFEKSIAEGIRGSFAIPNFILNREIFLDLVMNDPDFSLFQIDESIKAGSKTSSFYMIYEPEKIGSHLSPKRSGRKDIFVAKKQVPLFSDYLNVRISRAGNIKQIIEYKTLFECLIGAYLNNFDKIKKEYSVVFPEFKKITKEITASETKNTQILERVAPDIFVTGYARFAQANQGQPAVYNENNPEHEGKEVYNFENISLICPDPKYPYMGLKKNTLENKDEYPYLPKCFKSEDPEQKWEKYTQSGFQDLKVAGASKGGKRVMKKAVGDGKEGLLPRNIWYITGGDFYRSGTPFDTNSFIHAVLQAVDKEYRTSTNKTEYASNIRRSLISESDKVTVQELWDKPQSDIEQMILDESQDFDSKLFINCLQQRYNVRIYIFNREKDPNSTFEIPRYTQGYLAGKYPRAIMIYKHMGTEGQHLKTPHYELIRSNKTSFKSDKTLVRNLEKWFIRCYRVLGYSNSLQSLQSLQSIHHLNYKSQIIDSSGKVRGIVFDEEIGENSITMWTSPLSPEIESSNAKISVTSLQTVLQFIRDNNLKIISKVVENNKIIGVKTNAASYSFIKIEPVENDILEDIPISGYSLESKKGDNILKKTFDNRKIADFMIQFALYAFSKYIESTPFVASSENIQNDSRYVMMEKYKWYSSKLDSFMETVIVQSTDFLKDVPRRLSVNNSFFSNGSLIVDSEITKKKIKWVLQYNIDSDIDAVIDYKNRGYLENYYVLPEDYTEYPNTIIIIGEKSYIDWLKSDIIDRRIVQIPDSSVKSPQFWKNWVLPGVYIIQNVFTGSLKRALYIAEKYKSEGYNLGYYSEKELNVDNFNIIELKNGLLIAKNDDSGYDQDLVTVYKYSDGYAAVLPFRI